MQQHTESDASSSSPVVSAATLPCPQDAAKIESAGSSCCKRRRRPRQASSSSLGRGSAYSGGCSANLDSISNTNSFSWLFLSFAYIAQEPMDYSSKMSLQNTSCRLYCQRRNKVWQCNPRTRKVKRAGVTRQREKSKPGKKRGAAVHLRLPKLGFSAGTYGRISCSGCSRGLDRPPGFFRDASPADKNPCLPKTRCVLSQ